jgi:hypothetical protein
MYNSGLPTEFNGTIEDAAAQYGPDILRRVNFSDNRTRPNYNLSISAGAVLRQKEKQAIRLQVDVTNLTDQLNVINFTGLFSGTAIAAPRAAAGRVQFEF